MNELKKTAIYAAVALVLLTTAVLATWTGGPSSSSQFEDEGEKFFPEFTNPEQATTLEVVSFDETTGEPDLFKVTLEDGRWVIPSHYDYPADAEDRLARTAAGIIDLTKDTIRSDQPEDHKALGVLDPRDPKAVASPDGLGKRVTIRDASDKVLADLILGKPVPGAEGQRFVRVPGQNRVYGVQLEDVELSTRFADWIETNLLKLQPADLRKIVINDYKIDLARGAIQPGQPSMLERPDSSGDWTLQGGLPAGQEVDPQVMSTLASTLGNLEIVGVRPKPAGLTAELKGAEEKGRLELDQNALRSLASKGFHFVGNDLLSEEGDMTISTADGVFYLLRFGNVTFARGEALSAGKGETETAAEGSPEPKSDGAVESRYLFVDAQFNADLIPKPEPPQPWAEGELPDVVFARTAAEAESQKADREARARQEQEVYEKKVEAGRELARELRDRFAAWYYVVPGDAYRKIILDRSHLVRDEQPETAPTAPAPAGIPGLPGGIPGHGGAFPAPGR